MTSVSLAIVLHCHLGGGRCLSMPWANRLAMALWHYAVTAGHVLPFPLSVHYRLPLNLDASCCNSTKIILWHSKLNSFQANLSNTRLSVKATLTKRSLHQDCSRSSPEAKCVGGWGWVDSSSISGTKRCGIKTIKNKYVCTCTFSNQTPIKKMHIDPAHTAWFLGQRTNLPVLTCFNKQPKSAS